MEDKDFQNIVTKNIERYKLNKAAKKPYKSFKFYLTLEDYLNDKPEKIKIPIRHSEQVSLLESLKSRIIDLLLTDYFAAWVLYQVYEITYYDIITYNRNMNDEITFVFLSFYELQEVSKKYEIIIS
jgi:hypothetical protein